jgi:hypothetical protein
VAEIRPDGEIDESWSFTSRGTSGSAFSLTVTAAVVWGTNTAQMPSATPESPEPPL